MPMTKERAAQLIHDTVAYQKKIGHPVTIIYIHPLYLEFAEKVAEEHGLHVFSDRQAPLDRFLFR